MTIRSFGRGLDENLHAFGDSRSFGDGKNGMIDPATLPRYAHYNETSGLILNLGRVRRWDDISGNNRHASKTTAIFQPEIDPSGINGMRTLKFNAMEFLNHNNDGMDQSSFDVFIVCKNDLTTNTRVMSGNGSQQIYNMFCGGDRIEFRWNVPDFNVDNGKTTNVTGAKTYLFSNDQTNTVGSVNLNSVQVGSGVVPAPPVPEWSPGRIGTRRDADPSSFKFDGLIGEIIIFVPCLIPVIRFSVARFLSQRWGIF